VVASQNTPRRVISVRVGRTPEHRATDAKGADMTSAQPDPDATAVLLEPRFTDDKVTEWQNTYQALNDSRQKATFSDDHAKLFWQHGISVDARFNIRFGLLAAFQGFLLNAYVNALGKSFGAAGCAWYVAGAAAVLGLLVSASWLFVQYVQMREVDGATRVAKFLYNIGRSPHYGLIGTARTTRLSQQVMSIGLPLLFCALWLVATVYAYTLRAPCACWV
jgi:hypothetical protein